MVPARGVDVSPTGVCCVPGGPVWSRYVYVEFPRVAGLAGLAVLVELLRQGRAAAASNAGGEAVAGMYRVDLDGPVASVPSSADIRASRY